MMLRGARENGVWAEFVRSGECGGCGKFGRVVERGEGKGEKEETVGAVWVAGEMVSL